MNITTKYEIGQTLWLVNRLSARVWKRCVDCDGTCSITLKSGKLSRCPTCAGSGDEGYVFDGMKYEWVVHGSLVVSGIDIKLSKLTKGIRQIEMYQTGGSGFDVSRLFPTEKEAKEWCAKVNAEDPNSDEAWFGEEKYV